MNFLTQEELNWITTFIQFLNAGWNNSTIEETVPISFGDIYVYDQNGEPIGKIGYEDHKYVYFGG